MNKFVVVLVVLCAIGATAKKCKVTITESNKEKYDYDLSHFGDLTLDADQKHYAMNLCNGVKEGCGDDCAVCMSDADNEYVSLGRLSSRGATTIGGEDPGQGAVILFGDGDDCPGAQFTSTILLLCDPNEEEPVLSVLPDECDYSFQIISKYGCGVPHDNELEDLDPGEVFATVVLICFFVGLVLYFVVGAIYLKITASPATPQEYIIHREFWFGLPGLIVDGVRFIINGCKKPDYTPV